MKYVGKNGLKVGDNEVWHEGNFNPAGKAEAIHNHTKNQITDFPSSLPANGGNADTVGGKSAADFQRLTEGGAYGFFPSTANTMVGNEYNILLHAQKRGITATQSGTGLIADPYNLFDGVLAPSYSPNGIDPNNPYVLLIEGLPNIHTQTGGVFGWTSRYWYPYKYKVEFYDSYQNRGWKTALDHSQNPKASKELLVLINSKGLSGAITKIKITVYESYGGSVGNNGFKRWGLSELFFCHPEAVRVNQYLDYLYAAKDSVLTNVPANAKFTDTITTINGKTGAIAKTDITALGIPAQDTTYTEITTAEIDTGTASTLRTITARRIKYILDKVQGWINGLTKTDVGLGNVDNIQQASKTEFTAHNNDTTKHITSTERTAWNNKWNYNENTIKAVKVNNAVNADTVNGKTVAVNVPSGAKFTDTVYTHPASHPASMITESTTKRFVSDTEKATWNSKASKSVATTLADGLMASADKSKLNGIQAGAQVNTITSVAGKTGSVTLSKSDVGLSNVENKSSATIRGEITKTNVTNALNYTPVKDGGNTPELRSGIESARPSATGSGSVYFATDTQKIYKDTANGQWTQMGGQDLPIASKTVLGGIKVGNNLSITEDGVLSAVDNDERSSFVVKQEMFIATEGQTLFNLTKGHYQPNTNTISVYLYGGKQPNIVLNEISTSSFEINEPLKAGDVVLVEYIELSSATPYPIHGSDHLLDGYDPIPLATTSKEGLMSKGDKSKLDGIENGANKYVHPSTHPASIITESSSRRFVSDSEKATWDTVINKADTNYVDTELGKKVDNSRVLTDVPLNAKFTDTNTTYSEITTAEIDAGTSSTLRTITGRRIKYILDKVQGWINSLTKSDVGLSNVDNTSDLNKPISSATQIALDNKADKSQVLTNVPINAKFTDTITTINSKTGVISKADIVALGIPAQDTNTTYTAGQGLILTGTVFTPDFGTGAGKVVQGNDARLSDARTPLIHNMSSHSDINQALLTSSTVQFAKIGVGTSTPNESVDIVGNARVRSEGSMKFGGTGANDAAFEIKYNDSTKSLDFNFLL